MMSRIFMAKLALAAVGMTLIGLYLFLPFL